jgi:single-strand DNA-binding protein
MDINRATIVGRLTRDPEIRTTPSGINVTSFSVATNFVWSDASGARKEAVEYHNIVAWRKLGEIVAQYMRKGSRVLVEGRLQTRSWEGQDGAKRNRTEIVADNLIMLDSKGAAGSAATVSPPDSAPLEEPQSGRSEINPLTSSPEENSEEISVEDIPF